MFFVVFVEFFRNLAAKLKKKQFKNVFITGGAGFVGSLLVPTLLKKGYNVTVFDLYIYGDVLKQHPNLKEIKGDIRDREKLIESVKGADAVIHLASISNDPSFDLDPELGKSINYDAFPNVIDACTENNVGRLIIASSTSQYGIKPIDMDVTEETEAEPITDYAKYKIECEKLLLNTDVGDLEYVFVRPATLSGYSSRLRLDLLVNILTSHALINKKIKILGGEQMRPTLHIKDMVRFYELMLGAPKELIHKQAFNVAYQNKTVKEVGSLVRTSLNDDNIGFEVLPNDDRRSYHVNADKMTRVLGFKCKYGISDAVLDLRRAYKKGLIVDGLNNPIYHNTKRMRGFNLK